MTRPLTPAERQRLRTPANLWRALLPILLVVGVLVAWQRLGEPHSNGIHVVDTAAPVAAARQQAGFELLLPSGLTDRWRPTSTEFTPAAQYSAASFRIGYVTPADRYAEFTESDGPPDAVAAPYGVLTDRGPVVIAGASWRGFQTTDNRMLLRRTVGKVTVIVTGNAPVAELNQLAAALH
ncbi:MAG: DUF4245 domain-containing protein [Jatrophihabitantaceae bacterium]